MEKRSSVKEVYKLVQQDYPELYKKLNSILGDENPFAKFSIGAGNYIWSDNRLDWHQMIAWSPLKQELVKEALVDLSAKLTSQFGDKQAELLMTVPDDGYIYFNDDNGEIKVLITGWGFRKPVRIEVKPIVEEDVRKNPITLSFVYDGKRLPNYQFGLKLLNRVRKLQTDADGLFQMGNLGAGERYVIYDIQDNNKIYNLNIVGGQSHYDIDLTRHTTLYLSAIADNQPISNEQIDIQYHGSSYSALTDSVGKATLEIPLYEGENLSAKLREQTRSINVYTEDNHIDFVFETTPPVETDIIVTVIHDGSACSNKHVNIEYNGQKYDGETDVNGQFKQHVEVIKDEICIVSVDDYTSQNKELTDLSENEFIFEKNTAPDVRVTPKIIVQRENGEVVSDYPLSIEINGEENKHITDKNGEVILPAVKVNDTIKVIDGNDVSHIENYTISTNQDEYIFTISEKEPERQLKFMFRDKEGKPIQCNAVKFNQDGQDNVNVTLDENGDTYLQKETFKVDEEIVVSFVGCEEKYNPIPFVIEKDEYDYLIQEKTSTSSWKGILLHILAILAAIAALAILWPFLEGICAGLFEAIYS